MKLVNRLELYPMNDDEVENTEPEITPTEESFTYKQAVSFLKSVEMWTGEHGVKEDAEQLVITIANEIHDDMEADILREMEAEEALKTRLWEQRN